MKVISAHKHFSYKSFYHFFEAKKYYANIISMWHTNYSSWHSSWDNTRKEKKNVKKLCIIIIKWDGDRKQAICRKPLQVRPFTQSSLGDISHILCVFFLIFAMHWHIQRQYAPPQQTIITKTRSEVLIVVDRLAASINKTKVQMASVLYLNTNWAYKKKKHHHYDVCEKS